MKHVLQVIVMNFRALNCLFLVVTFSLTACLRYTPSRSELEEKYKEKESVSEGEKIAIEDEKAFDQYEAGLKTRLENLLTERSYLAQLDISDSGYKLGPGDILSLDVYGMTDLKSEAEINPAGLVALPLVGEINAGGMSLSDFRSSLAKSLSRFVRNPQITLSVKQYQANRVSVIGEVTKPGVYPLKRTGQLLTELLSEAGGRTDKASSRIILLPAPKRSAQVQQVAMLNPNNPSTEVAGVEIDMDQLMGRVDMRPLLVPLVAGDTIILPEMGTYEVDGEVTKPGSYKLSSRTSTLGAIAAAAGLTYAAKVDGVELIRDIGSGKKASKVLNVEEIALRGAKDLRLRDGDILRVPSEPSLFFKRQIVESINSLFRGVSVQQRAN